MASVEVVPRVQRLVLSHPALPDRRPIRDFLQAYDTGPEPFPYVFGAASSWFSSGRPLIKGWSGIGVDTKEGALVVVDLMEIVGHWEAAVGKSVQLQLQHVAAALKRTNAIQSNPLAQPLREAGCFVLDASWKTHCAAMYDYLFIMNQAPVPVGNLELLVLSGARRPSSTTRKALTYASTGRTWQNFMAAGIHPTMHKTKHLFDYHFAKYISIHDALPWEQYPAVGEPPLKSTMIAHANNLLRYITAKTSPWKSEFVEMAKSATQRYEIYKADGNKTQQELVQKAAEWIEQNFANNPVEMPSTEFLQSK